MHDDYIWKRPKKLMMKIINQKGAVLALTALLLPMIIVGAGLAVDFGNIYVQHARLQNAADAAAIAGVHTYSETNNKKSADDKSDEYIKGKYHNLAQDESIYNPDKQLKSDDMHYYYRVKLEKEVPLYFLGMIYKKIEKKDTFKVSAVSVASMLKKNDSILNHMFIIRYKFEAVNPVENPDLYNPQNPDDSHPQDGKITTSYDGSVIYTDPICDPKKHDYDRFTYSTQRPEYFDRFFTSAAAKYKDQNHTVRQMYEQFDKHREFWSQAQPDKYDFDKFIKKMNEITQNAKIKIDDQNCNRINLSNKKIFGNDKIRITKNVRNMDIVIDEKLSGSKDPIYIYFEPYPYGERMINIIYDSDYDLDNVRPLIICCDGDDNHTTKVHLDMDRNNRKNTFRGIVFAPYSEGKNEKYGEGIQVNAKNCKFKGSLVTGKLSIRGNYSSYEYVDYMGGGSGASGSGAGSPHVELTTGENIKWD